MRIIKLLHQQSGYFAYLFVFLGLLSGGLNAAIIPFINNVVSEIPADGKVAAINFQKFGLFFLMISALIISQRFFAKFLINLAEKLILQIRLDVLGKLRKANYYAFEQIGKEKIYASITRDASMVSISAANIVYATTSLITIVFCLGYLAWLSLIGFGVTMLATLLGVGFYLIRQKKISLLLETARQKEDLFFKYINDLLAGFKEVKVDQKKNDDLYLNHIEKVSYETRDLSALGTLKYMDNSLVGQISFLLLIGFILFLLPVFKVGATDIISCVFVILFIIGPIGGVMTVIPSITQANIALNHIEQINTQTNKIIEEHKHSGTPVVNFDSLEMKNVQFNYDTENNESFSVGPVNLSVKKGELVFISGGNGSGKTTLFKLLTGLYKPAGGSIRVNGSDLDLLSYRELFSPVYSDFYLFDKLYGYNGVVDENNINNLIDQMGLKDKVSFDNNAFSSISLSTGQRKRLALISALLENKSILVLDEWAADQDPQFRKYFYHTILPEIKKRGIAIIAITHDDSYFHLADKLYKMESGKLEEITKNTKADLVA